MSSVTTARVVLARLRTTALAAALACTASGAYAEFASVVIDGFTVGANADPAFFVFAPTDTRSQGWTLEAQDGGAPAVQNFGSVGNWSNVDQTAQTANAKATVSSSEATDPLTQLTTPLFSLSALANPASSVMNFALGNMLSSGSFCLWDSATDFDGTTASCSGAGSLTFMVFYDLLATPAPGGASTAYAEINIFGSGVPNGLFVDLASTVLNIGSKEDQFFTWTVNLAVGESADFGLAGIVVAEVPEPGVLSLAALGLIGLAATRRRNARGRFLRNA